VASRFDILITSFWLLWKRLILSRGVNSVGVQARQFLDGLPFGACVRMEIEAGGANGRMAKQRCNRGEVHPCPDELGGEGMSQRMYSKGAILQARSADYPSEEALQAGRAHPLSGLVDNQSPGWGSTLLEVLCQSAPYRFAQRNYALVTPLGPTHFQLGEILLQGGAIELDELVLAQPAQKQEGEDRPLAWRLARLQQPPGFFGIGRIRDFPPALGAGNGGHGVDLNAAQVSQVP